MCQISVDNHTKEDGPKEDLLILQYNLDGKVQKQYQDMCKYGSNTICWYHPIEYTDDLDPPDAGTGKQIKFWFGVYLHEWIWDSGNVYLWQFG